MKITNKADKPAEATVALFQESEWSRRSACYKCTLRAHKDKPSAVKAYRASAFFNLIKYSAKTRARKETSATGAVSSGLLPSGLAFLFSRVYTTSSWYGYATVPYVTQGSLSLMPF